MDNRHLYVLAGAVTCIICKFSNNYVFIIQLINSRIPINLRYDPFSFDSYLFCEEGK